MTRRIGTRTQRERKMLPLGSLSTGTLRTPDLLDALYYELRTRWPKRLRGAHQRRLHRDVLGYLRAAAEGAEPEGGEELLAEVQDDLQGYVPPFCYLGALEGDGADWGVWPDEEDIREHTRWVTDLSEIERGWTGNVCVVNDHGNRTVGWVSKSGRWVEYWATV